MFKRIGFFCCLIYCFCVLASGCETAKGAAEGVSSTVGGVAKDTMNLWAGMKKTDKWMRDNLW